MQDKNVLEELLEARSPADYAEAAVLQREVLKEVLSRLSLITLKPHLIMDVGCATGDSTAMLKKQYPNAHIIAIDSSTAMLDYAKQTISSVEWLCTSFTSLPLSDHSVDFILANLTMPWCDDLKKLFCEWRRILKPNGLLMVTTLGPDTLRELHHLPLAFPHLIDMHDVGDLLTQTGFKDPVLDVDYFTLTYRDPPKLWHELQVTGMIAGEVKPLLLEKKENHYEVSVEVIFGHAFGPDFNANHTADEKGEVRIPVSHILRR